MEGRQETIEATLHIVWMHAFGPSRAHFLLHASASELEPRSVEIIATSIRAGHPNQHRRRIGHFLEPRLAFPQSFFSTLQLSEKEQAIAEKVLKEIQRRLSFLSDVGLDSLSLIEALLSVREQILEGLGLSVDDVSDPPTLPWLETVGELIAFVRSSVPASVGDE